MRVDNAVLRHLNPPASQGGSKKHLELKFSGIDFGAITIGCGVSQVGIAYTGPASSTQRRRVLLLFASHSRRRRRSLGNDQAGVRDGSGITPSKPGTSDAESKVPYLPLNTTDRIAGRTTFGDEHSPLRDDREVPTPFSCIGP